MAKPRKKEKLPSTTPNRTVLGSGDRASNWPGWTLPALGLGVSFLVCILVFSGLPINKLSGALSHSRGPMNFGHVVELNSLLKSSMTIRAVTEDLVITAPLLASWQARMTLPQEIDFGRRLRPITFVVLSSLGVRNPWDVFATQDSTIGFDLSREGLYTMLSDSLKDKIDRPVLNASLRIENGRASEFQIDQTGQDLDVAASIQALEISLFLHASTTLATIRMIEPQIKLAQTNSLGIKERIAHGESDFHGSTKNRINNITIGSSKFNGVIIKPGEEFSFNTYLGPVTEELGFKPELVIKTAGTVPELGGGLCQVSTTAFRVALYGGFPITARRNHSYAVKYYSPQGTDATIYPGVQDMKFVNDSPAFLLIATHMEGTKLYFDFYGTPDYRTVTIDGPHAYDYAPDGSMKARLTRTVFSNNASTTQTFLSKYVSKDLFPVQYGFPTVQPPATLPQPVPDTTTPPPTEIPPPVQN